MEKEFVPYEQALELKELGFDELCITRYCTVTEWEKPTGEIFLQLLDCMLSDKNLTKAPLYQQAFRWFREKYGISVSISINWEEGIGKDSSYGKYACSLEHKSYDESIGEFIGVFEKYEKAELKCLKGLIEMVKENEL